MATSLVIMFEPKRMHMPNNLPPSLLYLSIGQQYYSVDKRQTVFCFNSLDHFREYSQQFNDTSCICLTSLTKTVEWFQVADVRLYCRSVKSLSSFYPFLLQNEKKIFWGGGHVYSSCIVVIVKYLSVTTWLKNY